MILPLALGSVAPSKFFDTDRINAKFCKMPFSMFALAKSGMSQNGFVFLVDLLAHYMCSEFECSSGG